MMGRSRFPSPPAEPNITNPARKRGVFFFAIVQNMATREEVQKLAALARISIHDSELDKFTKEFDAILAYVGQLEKLEIEESDSDSKAALRNVMRADGVPHEDGLYTQKIVNAFPDKDGNALAVKQIITHE